MVSEQWEFVLYDPHSIEKKLQRGNGKGPDQGPLLSRMVVALLGQV